VLVSPARLSRPSGEHRHPQSCQPADRPVLLGPDQAGHFGLGRVQTDLQGLDFTAPAVGLGFREAIFQIGDDLSEAALPPLLLGLRARSA
jgi:hypothetical protein